MPPSDQIRAARALLAVLLALGVGCAPAPVEREGAPASRGEHRDILLVTVDTLRWDATGFSGAGRAVTPAADRLAADGRVYRFAHAHAVVTLPSHTSILTGLYPYQHGVHDNAGYVVDGSLPTAATIFKAAGYRTAAFVSAYPLDRRFGLARGFDTYDDEYEGYQGATFTPPERPGDQTVARALRWWREQRGTPRFLWVHTFTPHYPYKPGPRFSVPGQPPYYGDAARADAELAPLIDAVLGADDGGTIVVYTSDHGESLGEHGERTHGLFAYEATLHVPLVVRAPGLLEPGAGDEPARHVDILPTLLDLVGLAAPAALPGRSLARPPAADHDLGSYFEALSTWLNRGWAPLYGRIEGGVKAIRLPLPELYDLHADPAETRNLAPTEQERWREILASVPDPTETDDREQLDEEAIARLRSLGYAAGAPQRRQRYGPESDPKNLVAYDTMLATALAQFTDGEHEPAISTLSRLIEEQPQMGLAYTHLAFFYADLGRIDDAVAILRRAIRDGASNESIRRKLALILVRRGEGEEAWQVLSPDAGSNDPETQSALGRVAAMLGRFEEAHARFDRALELDPTYPTALMDLGILLMTEGRFDEAGPPLEQALRHDAFLAEAWNALGVVRSRRGDTAAAVEAWRRAVEVDPRMTDALWNLALTLGRSGDRDGAAEALRRYIPLAGADDRARAETMLRQLEASGARGG